MCGQHVVRSSLQHPFPDLRIKGTFHYKEGYYYFRDLAGGILLGGGRELDIDGETTAEEGTTPLIQDALETLLREVILPGTNFLIHPPLEWYHGLGPYQGTCGRARIGTCDSRGPSGRHGRGDRHSRSAPGSAAGGGGLNLEQQATRTPDVLSCMQAHVHRWDDLPLLT